MLSCCTDVRILVCIIVVLFGMGSWITINGLWVELPILVEQLPEGWNLPSYMTVVIQIANIGPIAITIAHVCLPGKVKEQPIVYVMVLVESVAALLLVFFWKETSFVAGEEHSTALLVLMFFLSLNDCTSSVVFLPFMNIFKPQYMTSYFIGEGFSGLVPSLVALGQGVGQVECHNVSTINSTTNMTEYSIQPIYLPPNFPVEDFFYFLFAMMITCGISFIMLNHLPYCKSEHVKNSPGETYSPDNIVDTNNYELGPEIATVGSSTQKFIDTSNIDHGDDHGYRYSNRLFLKSDSSDVESFASTKMSTCTYFYFLLLTGWMNALTNGILPSIQSYACLPYGSQPYHLAVTLSNIANPVACFIVFFLPVKSQTLIGGVTSVGSLISVYILLLAATSPGPPLVDSLAGPILVVAAYVLVYLLLTFSKVTIATLFRYEGSRALLWCGAMQQLGSALGAAIMFVLVNVFKLFVQKYPCT